MTSEQIEQAFRYCLGHCDTDQETEIVEWVKEKFAEHSSRFAREKLEKL